MDPLLADTTSSRPVILTFRETVMWPTVTRARSALPSSVQPRFGSVFLIAVEMGLFALDPQPHTPIDQSTVEPRRLHVLLHFVSRPSRLYKGLKSAPGAQGSGKGVGSLG